ncbi:hypothetical protein OG772_20310 [Streptomyces sp. NBC_01321]|uniref:hypothetical protein n=1 Tax=Streptomyces sp. NBC_01321 TaxID=2903825 RepID=UPI002E0D4B9F|nr:hypothetical protein OG772_20310 [Streptomyces sp. NBC_01321]
MIDSARCHELNEEAEFLPVEPGDPDSHPALRIAGVLVFAYVHPKDGLVVSVDLDETEPELIREDDTVPMLVSVGITTVFADPPRNNHQ